MRNRESFNKAALLYDEVRPTYPDDLIKWIIEKTELKSTDEIFEIAPGTGQCTRKFAELDYKIHAVELGDKLAELLMLNLKDKKVSVDVSSFEEWNPPLNKQYPLIYCATAWHWIDSTVKYKKTYDLLTDDGRLAIIWNNALGIGQNKIMDEAYKLLFSYHKETPNSTKPRTEDELKAQSLGTQGMLEESGHYQLGDYYETTWSYYQPREQVIKGFYTQSSYLSLSIEDQSELSKRLQLVFKQLDEEVETFFKSVVYLLRKNK